MSERQTSRTALGVAYVRAAHQLLDAPPRILEDPVALPLLGPAGLARIRAAPERYRGPDAEALRAHVVLRSRFAEDRLAAAVGRGVTQYVLLGAGFDTFALRQPAWAMGLKIFEVDHGGTQSEKRARMADAGLALPGNTALVEVDFERESLWDRLQEHRVSWEEPTFFSWLGVTMYLEEEAIDAVLRSVAAFPAGSELVLTFATSDSRPGASGGAPSPFADRAAALGEPWVSYFSPEEFEAKLRQAGFSAVEFLSPAEAEARYFQGRPRDLPVPPRKNLVAAVV